MSTSRELTANQRYWLVHIEACEASGLSIRAYADAQGLPVGSLYNARHRLKQLGVWRDANAAEANPGVPADPKTLFQRVVVRPDPDAPASSPAYPVPMAVQGAAPCRIHLPNGVLLEVTTGTDACALAAVVQAAGAWP